MNPALSSILLVVAVLTFGCGSEPPTPVVRPVVSAAPQPPKPPKPSPLRAIAIDAAHNSTCVVASDATVWCWGPVLSDASGIPRKVEGLTSASKVSIGSNHVCALHRDATVSCVGVGPVAGAKPGWWSREVYRVPNLEKVEALASAPDQSCAIVAGGEVRCWGHSPKSPKDAVRTIELPIAAEQIAAGSRSACVIGDGDLWCFHLNARAEPARLGREKYTAVAMTDRGGVCALQRGGGIRCFGSPCTNRHSPWKRTCETSASAKATALTGGGRICARFDDAWRCWTGAMSPVDPETEELRLPSPIPQSAPIDALAIGHEHACSLTSEGRVDCWGRDAFGALGRGGAPWTRRRYATTRKANTAAAVALPSLGICSLHKPHPKCFGQIMLGGSRTLEPWTEIPQAAGAHAIHARDDNMCAVRSSDVVCWGILFNEPTSLPVAKAHAIALGDKFGCAIAGDDRAIHCWGRGRGFSMPNDDPLEREGHAPGPLPDQVGAKVIAAGTDHVCWQHDGVSAVMCMGSVIAEHGQNTAAVPTKVADLPPIQKLVAGRKVTCALVDGAVKCWGDGRDGGLGNDTWSISTSPVDVGLSDVRSLAASRDHFCAVSGDGRIHCWGRNMSAELGTGDRQRRNAPTPVPGITTAREVVVGPGHTCAIMQDDEVLCWGWGATRLFDPEAGPYRVLPPGPTLALGAVPVVELERVTELRDKPYRF